MFFEVALEKRLQVHPKAFGPKLHAHIIRQLMKTYEGTCMGRYGFLVIVTDVESIGEGVIQEGVGFVTIPVSFKAIVFRPFIGEVLVAVVTQVNKMGFFAEAGPLQVFVSNHLIPADMEFDAHGNPPCYVSADQMVRVQKESHVRLRINGMRIETTEIVAIGTIKEDFLGVI